MADHEETINKAIDVLTTNATPSGKPTTDIDFERYKLGLEFKKWLLGTFLIGFLGFLVNWNLSDRKQGLLELSQYDKYVSELIVLNKNPEKKRMIAQFFSTVSPSSNIKCGWETYFNKVELEYNDYMKKNLKMQNEYDSLKKRELSIISNSKDTLSKYDRYRMNKLERELENIYIEKNKPIEIPDSKDKSANSSAVIQKEVSKKLSGLDYEKLAFQAIAGKDYDLALTNFKSSYDNYPTLHNVQEIYNLLKSKKIESKDAAAWKQFYKKILNSYSWGMPEESRVKIKDILEE